MGSTREVQELTAKKGAPSDPSAPSQIRKTLRKSRGKTAGFGSVFVVHFVMVFC